MRTLAAGGCVVLLCLVVSGCGGTTAVTRVTIEERDDSLEVPGVDIRFVASSDTLQTEVYEEPAPAEMLPGMVEDAEQPMPRPRVRTIRAVKDTTIGSVLLQLQYRWPMDQWTVLVAEPDSLIRWKVRDSLIERPYEVEVVPFWVYMVLAIAGLCVVAVVVMMVKGKPTLPLL